ncbi:hypothetical protein GCM10009081_11070 [Brevundimonas nasdae]
MNEVPLKHAFLREVSQLALLEAYRVESVIQSKKHVSDLTLDRGEVDIVRVRPVDAMVWAFAGRAYKPDIPPCMAKLFFSQGYAAHHALNAGAGIVLGNDRNVYKEPTRTMSMAGSPASRYGVAAPLDFCSF